MDDHERLAALKEEFAETKEKVVESRKQIVGMRERMVVEFRFQVAGVVAYTLFLTQQSISTWPDLVAIAAAGAASFFMVFAYFFSALDESRERALLSRDVLGVRSSGTKPEAVLSSYGSYVWMMGCLALSALAFLVAVLFPEFLPADPAMLPK